MAETAEYGGLMKIQVLGSGCAKCIKLTENVNKVIKEMNLDADVEKVTDIDEIMNFGVMMTPALAIDGEVKSAGKLLTPDEIKRFLT